MKTEMTYGEALHIFKEEENGFGPTSVVVTQCGDVFIDGWTRESIYHIHVHLPTGTVHKQEWPILKTEEKETVEK